MSTITKERIELFIKNPLENGLTRGEQMELARIALASLEAKPIGAFHIAEQQVDGTSDYLKDGEWPIDNGIIEVYAAPPVPVVPEEKPMPNPLSMYAVDAVAAIAEVRGWNACRAAMLQSGNFRENKNSSTNNFREIAETSTNYPVIPSEVLSAILKVAKIRADFDDFDGDRRGIGDCLDEAEQELIVTINKYASQLAAEPIATNDVREQTAVPPVPVIQADVAQAIEKLKRKLVECNRYNYCADAVKNVEDACHAAMLQGSQPVSKREQVRREHAEWSDKTFGDVGPVGPLKHLSKEALEAAAEPDDLSEWADMQFLLWDAQRRAGISDGEITAAMEEKLKVNMARQWPEPKDGEPRQHLKPAPQTVPDSVISAAVNGIMATYADNAEDCREMVRTHVEQACRAAIQESGHG